VLFRRLLSVVSRLTFASALFTSLAHAELTPIERATAEALFQEAVQLMDQGNYTRACEKFSGTLEIEPGLGTMLHLADCYDKVNRTASSWALFEEVASRANLAGDSTRASIASARASELKARLSLVYLDLKSATSMPDALARVSVTIGETLIPAAMWNSSIPLDPGQQRLTVTAEGHEPWSFSLIVAPGPSLRRVTIPPLQRKASVKTPLKAPVNATTTATRPIATSLPHPPSRPESPTSSTPRVLGYISGALGLVGLGVSGYFGYRAYQSRQSSLESCRASNPNLCTPAGVDRREDAFGFADVANVSAIAGGSCLLIGTTLLIVSPSTSDASSQTAMSPPFANTSFRTPTVSLRREW
jgi:hypothetical protein